MSWLSRNAVPAAILACALAVPSPASANLISNGGFESPVVPSGDFELFARGTSFDSWMVLSVPADVQGNVAPISGLFVSPVSPGRTFPSQAGAQWLDLTGLSNSPTGVEQAVATAIGAVHDLSFWVGNQVNPGGIYGITSTVEVFIEGVSVGTFTNQGGAGTSTLNWQQFSLSFTALDDSTAISFINRDPVTDNSNGLDSVVLNARSAAGVPEPGSLSLLGLSLVAFALARRRRKAE